MTEQQINKEAEELGVLVVGGPRDSSGSSYGEWAMTSHSWLSCLPTRLTAGTVGSATGTTFARIFLKQLNILPTPPHSDGRAQFEQEITCQNAALPPERVAAYLLIAYIGRTHTAWPMLRLPMLRRTFHTIYNDPKRCSTYEKFSIFLVLALASAQCVDDQVYERMADANTPTAYFRTGLRLFSNFVDHPRDLDGLQAVLLVGLWMLNSDWDAHVNDLWHLSRYVMSMSIEIGIHRRNAGWSLSSDELETRNRVWWCVYNLERQVAVITGRVLSIRDHAIDTPQPSAIDADSLTNQEALAAPIFHKLGVRLSVHVIKLRRISGRILESVYIARGPDGKSPLTTFRQIFDEFNKIRQDLEEWKRGFDALDIKGSREHSELKVEYNQLLLIMHRPSPTFMIPSPQMIATCSKAVSSSVRQWARLQSGYGQLAVCRCSRQLHSILMVGLAGLYCDWSVRQKKALIVKH